MFAGTGEAALAQGATTAQKKRITQRRRDAEEKEKDFSREERSPAKARRREGRKNKDLAIERSGFAADLRRLAQIEEKAK